MILNKPITLYPYPYRNDTGHLIVPDPITLTELDVSYIIRKKQNMAYAQISHIPGVINLTSEQNQQDISWYTVEDFENILSNQLGDEPEKYLQTFFPITVDSDPDGPGTVLSNMLSYIGINSSANCSCKRHAIEMNQRGNQWCEDNIDIILGWLKEESIKRKLPFIETVARLIVSRAIATSKKMKAKNGKV
jgi:hypothetical protein